MRAEFIKPNGVVKRRSGETVGFEVVLSGFKPEKVELWIECVDEHHRAVAKALSLRSSSDDKLVFCGDVTFKSTGCFVIKLRYVTSDNPLWVYATDYVTVWVDPSWIYDAIVYNAFVRYFGAKKVDDEGSIRKIVPGTFSDVKDHMKKLHDMGVNVLYLNPVHMIGELYKNYNPHDLLPEYLQPGCPYSIKDYKSVDPELSFGVDQSFREDHPFSEFKKLVDAAHEFGMRVIMDLVFNHSAHDSVFQRLHPEWYLYKQDITSLTDPYLYPEDLKKGLPWGDPKHTFAPYDHGHWWRDAAQLNWNNITSYPDFIMPHIAANDPPKNPTIDQMYKYFINVVKFWIREFGIDGFRCDVAYRVPLDFWRECILTARQVAKQSYPDNGSVDGDVVFIAEDYHVALKDLLSVGFTAVYGDYSNKLYDVASLSGYLDYMYNLSGDHFPDGSLFFIFPECHDFHRNPTKIVDDLRKNHKDADLNANKSRWTLTATLPGIPMIFNGFEKIEWQPASLFSYSMIDWESDKDISDHIKKVNLIRRKYVVLQRGSYRFLHTSHGISHDAQLFAFARILDGECFIVVVNMDVSYQTEGIVYLPEDLPVNFDSFVLEDVLNDQVYSREGKELFVKLDAGEAHIFKVTNK